MLKATLTSIAFVVAVVPCLSTYIVGQEISKADGGSIRTDLGYNIVLNKGSSLRREWVAFHENLPLTISGTPGVTTVWKSGEKYSRGEYNYTARATVTASQAVTAFQIRFVSFDVFGERMATLGATEIEDIAAGASRTFDWSWNAYREPDVSKYFASVAFIASVRTKDGQVHVADYNAVLQVVRQFFSEATEGDCQGSDSCETGLGMKPGSRGVGRNLGIEARKLRSGNAGRA